MDKKIEVIQHLKELEKNKGIYLLFAVETGSRVWRLQSKDSDFDIRFVYKRPVEDYLRINKLPDVIEKLSGNMDFVGFDIFKFTKLLLTSNPSMIEWLKSDIIYFDDGKTKEKLKEFIEKKYNPVPLYHHYKSMCKQNYLKYLKTCENMTYKKYLYAMRGLINAKWVTQFKTTPPINFNKTLDLINHLPDEVINKLREIIELKKEGLEEVKVSKIHLFESFIESFLKEEDTLEQRKIIDYSEIQNYIFEIMGLQKGGKRASSHA